MLDFRNIDASANNNQIDVLYTSSLSQGFVQRYDKQFKLQN